MNPRLSEAYTPVLADGAYVLGDESDDEQTGFSVSFTTLAKEHGGKEIYANAAAAVALCAMLSVTFNALEQSLQRAFSKHGESAVDDNRAVARAAYDAADSSSGRRLAMDPPQGLGKCTYVTGQQAIAWAAAARCRFMSAYSMSASTSIITVLSRDPELRVFNEQVEDEVAAINNVSRGQCSRRTNHDCHLGRGAH